MAVDVILVTETGESIGPVSHYCKESGGNLILIYQSKLEEESLIRIQEMRDGTNLTVLKADRYSTMSLALNTALTYCGNPWVLIINDVKCGMVHHLAYLESVVVTVPRLASLRPTSTIGLINVQYSPLFGTLFNVRLFQEVLGFDPTVHDLSVVAYDWARHTTERGWCHMTVYVQGLLSSPLSVSDGGMVEPCLETSRCDDYLVPKLWAEGNISPKGKKPWHYRVTVVIPHYGKNLRLLMSVIESWRLQREKPYILIYDTGTPSEHHAAIRSLSGPDVEVNLCRWNGFRGPYDCVAMAYNFGMASCRTNFLVFTHNDVLPLSQTVLSDLLSRCCREFPVVGYESFQEGLIGTQLTAVNMPMMRQIRAGWDLDPSARCIEEGFTRCVVNAGFKPGLIGKERLGRTRTPYFDHVGGVTSAEIHFKEKFAGVQAERDGAVREAEERLMVWRGA